MLIAFNWGWNPTTLCGFAGYGLAALGSAWALLRQENVTGRARLPLALMTLAMLQIADLATDFRWWVYRLLRGAAEQMQVYEMRHGPQTVCLLVLAVLTVLMIRTLGRRLRGRPFALLAVAGSLLSIAVWLAEIISLHAVDMIFYKRLESGVHWVAFLWMTSGLMTCIGMVLDSRRRP